MDKQVRIVAQRREPLDLERLAEALLDLALALEAAERREPSAPTNPSTLEAEVSKPEKGRAA